MDVLLGLRSVEAALLAGERKFSRLLVEKGSSTRLSSIVSLAEQRGVLVKHVPKSALQVDCVSSLFCSFCLLSVQSLSLSLSLSLFFVFLVFSVQVLSRGGRRDQGVALECGARPVAALRALSRQHRAASPPPPPMMMRTLSAGDVKTALERWLQDEEPQNDAHTSEQQQQQQHVVHRPVVW
jgi:hypothetical protein